MPTVRMHSAATKASLRACARPGGERAELSSRPRRAASFAVLSLTVIPDRPSLCASVAGIVPDIFKIFPPSGAFRRRDQTLFDFALESTLVQRQSDFRKTTKGRQMASELQEGAKAPAFKLAADNGEKITLADFKGKKLVVFFYPRADTPGCTKESVAFSALKEGVCEGRYGRGRNFGRPGECSRVHSRKSTA